MKGLVGVCDTCSSMQCTSFKTKLQSLSSLSKLSIFSKDSSGSVRSYLCSDSTKATTIKNHLSDCTRQVDDISNNYISCQTPIVTECGNQYWVVGMCCGGVGLMVNPKERVGSTTAGAIDSFCGCTDSSGESNGCDIATGSDLIRSAMISIMPCMKRTYCATNWGGYGGQCSPSDHTLSLTFNS